MTITLYTLTSALHDEQSVKTVTQAFLDSLHLAELNEGRQPEVKDLLQADDFGSHDLDLIYVRTGGTEGLFKPLLPMLRARSKAPVYLLTSGKSNSLAASLEILSYLRQKGIPGEVIHGNPEYINHRIGLLAKAGEARRRLRGCRLGVIGQPSDWLIASEADYGVVAERLGVELVDIPMTELTGIVKMPADGDRMKGAQAIYEALKEVVARYALQGFTLRCFDLLTTVRNTGCLALAKLNAKGVVAGCEGDVPTLLSMTIANAIAGVSGFQANPSRIDPEAGEMLFAHCTIPFNMVERYEFDTHFESGIGVGIRGYMKEGPVTVFKVSGDLSRCFVAEGRLVRNEAKPDLCRTQQVIQLNEAGKTAYFLHEPIGNHHVILPGHHEALLREVCECL